MENVKKIVLGIHLLIIKIDKDYDIFIFVLNSKIYIHFLFLTNLIKIYL